LPAACCASAAVPPPLGSLAPLLLQQPYVMTPPMIIAALLVAAAAGLLFLPSLSDLLSLARLARGRSRGKPPPRGDLPRLLFLVPAHDEELLVEHCVRSLLQVSYPRERFDVVVVADNCDDRTASRALAAGARCLERYDSSRPGKPHAIALALQNIRLEAYDAVVIIDADTSVDAGFATALARAAPLAHKVVQPYNDVANSAETALTRMASVFAGARYRFLYPLKHRAGLNVPISAGMCIGTQVLAEHGWKAFSIGEDWELYALLTARGVPIELCAEARLYAQEARSLGQSAPQRRRWSAGKLTVLGRSWRRILGSPTISSHQKIDTLAELAAPGPVVHLAMVAVLTTAVRFLMPSGAAWLLPLLWASLVRPALSSAAALWTQPERWRALAAFAFLPAYALWRLVIEVMALQMVGDKPWIRTARHPYQDGRECEQVRTAGRLEDKTLSAD